MGLARANRSLFSSCPPIPCSKAIHGHYMGTKHCAPVAWSMLFLKENTGFFKNLERQLVTHGTIVCFVMNFGCCSR